MKQETIEKLKTLQYRISRLNNMISALTNYSPYQDVRMGKVDEKYIIEYCGNKIQELQKEIEEL